MADLLSTSVHNANFSDHSINNSIQLNEKALNEKLLRWSAEIPEIKKYVTPHTTEVAILLTGSVNDGLANETSDLDFIELYNPSQFIPGWIQRDNEGREMLDPGSLGGFGIPQANFLYWHNALSSGRRIQRALSSVEQVEYLQDQVIARNESNLVRICGGKSPAIRGGVTLSDAELRFLQRIYTGTIIYNESLIERIKARLPIEELINYNLVRQLTLLESVIADIKGLSIERFNDDQDTIVLLLRKALQHTSNIHLLTAGELNISEKLVYRLLKRHAEVIGEQKIDEIFATLRLSPDDISAARDDIIGVVDRHLEAAGKISSYLADDLRSRVKSPTWNPTPDSGTVQAVL